MYHPLTYGADFLSSIVPQKITRSLDFSVFNQYLLFSNLYMTEDKVGDIPRQGVRLDDLAVGCVLASGRFKRGDLVKYWPAEFDVAGFPRATRAPLGFAYKIRVEAGDRDAYGNIATAEDKGFYVGWWRGLQPLMGKEGMDAGMYTIRPSHEDFLCDGFGWKMSCKCPIQVFSGHIRRPQ